MAACVFAAREEASDEGCVGCAGGIGGNGRTGVSAGQSHRAIYLRAVVLPRARPAAGLYHPEWLGDAPAQRGRSALARLGRLSRPHLGRYLADRRDLLPRRDDHSVRPRHGLAALHPAAAVSPPPIVSTAPINDRHLV